jgi:uncharacterized membrane protein
MTTKRFLISWLAATVVLFILNGIFHGLVAADFFDKNLVGLGGAVVKMADFNPAPVAVLELLLVFCMTWIFAKTHSEKTTLRDVVTIGAIFQLCTSATWSLANMATLVSWPISLALVDVAWHTLMGALAGWLIYRVGLKTMSLRF